MAEPASTRSPVFALVFAFARRALAALALVSAAAASPLAALQEAALSPATPASTPGEFVTQSASSFGALDWSIVAGLLLVTTAIGAFFGRQATIRDFFLGGRKLPWWAVSASIVATEISALTLVSVPWVVYQPGGNFAYLQLTVLGSVIARALIAWFLVPLYYQREIYSPYEFMGERLGSSVRVVASSLFALGGVLSQAARVYLTALVLEVILHAELRALATALQAPLAHVPIGAVQTLAHDPHALAVVLSVAIITLFAVVWTWIGGIVSVVWTDVLLFVVFVVAAIVALVTIASHLDTGFARIWQVGIDSQRFQFFDFSTSAGKNYTFWAAVIAASWGNIGAYGVDQLMAQRLFCCKDVRAARLAIVTSSVSVLVGVLVAFVGVGLVAYYERHPLTGESLAIFQKGGDTIFPIFVTDVVPSGFKGLIVAGIFAAAISSLDAILMALSQTVVTSIWMPWRARKRARGRAADLPTEPISDEDQRGAIRLSRRLVVVFGVLLAAISVGMAPLSKDYKSLLDLGLSMAGYTQGALLAGLFLALLWPAVQGSGYLWSAPLSVAAVFAAAWHGKSAEMIVLGFGGVMALLWLSLRVIPELRRGGGRPRLFLQTLGLVFGLLALVWTVRHGLVAVPRGPAPTDGSNWQPLAFPWYVPLGCTVAFTYGLILARKSAPRTA